MAARGTATRGKRVDLVPATKAEAQVTAIYVCGARPLDFGDLTLTEGVEVPGAADWHRLEAWVSARRVRQLRVDEEYTPFEDFKAAADAKAAELAEEEAAALRLVQETWGAELAAEIEAKLPKEPAESKE